MVVYPDFYEKVLPRGISVMWTVSQGSLLVIRTTRIIQFPDNLMLRVNSFKVL